MGDLIYLDDYRKSKGPFGLRLPPGEVIITNTSTPSCYHLFEDCTSIRETAIKINLEKLKGLLGSEYRLSPCQFCTKHDRKE